MSESITLVFLEQHLATFLQGSTPATCPPGAWTRCWRTSPGATPTSPGSSSQGTCRPTTSGCSPRTPTYRSGLTLIVRHHNTPGGQSGQWQPEEALPKVRPCPQDGGQQWIPCHLDKGQLWIPCPLDGGQQCTPCPLAWRSPVHSLPRTPVFPSMGNHESFPVNMFPGQQNNIIISHCPGKYGALWYISHGVYGTLPVMRKGPPPGTFEA